MTADPHAPLDELVTAKGGVLDVPDHWQLGRGAFGGFVTAAMVRALEDSAPDRPLRSLTAELCGPLQPGDATLELSMLRAGNAVTTSAVRVVQGGEVQAHGVGVLGRARPVEGERTELGAPALPAWRDVEERTVDGIAVFSKHFEFRPVTPMPFGARNSTSDVLGWVRPKRPGKRRDAAYLAACIDSYWPTYFQIEPVLRPMATIAFTFQPFTARLAGLDPDAPLAYRARLATVDAGYCVELRELWGEDGRLVALNQQTFVVIK